MGIESVNPNQVYCILDYETKSKADITKVGGFEYATHPSTKIMCVAWRIGTRAEIIRQLSEDVPARAWSPAMNRASRVPALAGANYGDFKRALLDPNVILIAHNAFFEQVITRYVLSRMINAPYLKEIPHDRWICTASQARALALPGKLEGACLALQLPVQKDTEGHRLMLKLSKPRKPTKNNPSLWHRKLSDLHRLIAYCVTDVDAEAHLWLNTKPLSPFEREVWLLDQKINFRGFRADRPTVKKVLTMLDVEVLRMNRLGAKLTGGAVPAMSKRPALQKWLNQNGCDIPNLQAKTVADALKAGKAPRLALRVLKLRQATSKASTAKFTAYDLRSRFDGRIRDSLVYHTASTGRWGGAGLQPHNFPRGTPGFDASGAIKALGMADLELIRLMYGKPMEVFSNCLRGMIRASKGKELFGGDYAGIEVRVLFWMARHEKGLEAYRKGADLYREMAAVIFGVKLKDVTKEQREIGKRAILGCGYGMGGDKFEGTCEQFNQPVTKELASKAVKAYRSVHSPVTAFWKNTERAAIAAVQNPGKAYKINKVKWFVKGRYLWAELPSGRRLAFYGPRIKYEPTPWGDVTPRLYHWDVHPKTKKWVFVGTYGGRLVENVVQATARDFMAPAMIRAEKAGYDILITVHDEILAEREKGTGTVKAFEDLMSEIPAWGKGAPIKVEGWKGSRYRK